MAKFVSKFLKFLLVFFLWIIEYLFFFGVIAVALGKQIYEISMVLYWIFFFAFLFLARLTWRLIFKKKNNNDKKEE